MQSVIDDGSALEKLAQLVRAQGGDTSYVYDTSLFPGAAFTKEVRAETAGYVHRILAREVGSACMLLGGGRETKESSIDTSVGILLKKKNGDEVRQSDTLAVIYGNDADKTEQAARQVARAYEISAEKKECPPVVRAYISE